MGILSSKLPELPENFPSRFFVTYTKCFDDNYYYILTGVSDAFSGTVTDKGNVLSDLTHNFVLVNNEWCCTFDKDYSYYRSTNTADIVYSSYDIYTDTGDYYFYKSDYDFDEVNVIGNTLTSSSIIHSLRSDFLPVVFLVVPAFVLFIGFRKAWSFLTSLIRGA